MMQTTTTPRILSQDQLKRIAPAVFAAHAAPSTSSRYAFVPTSEVVTVLGRQGFEPVAAQEKRVRIEARRGYQSHVIRFRRTAAGRTLNVGDSIYELVLYADRRIMPRDSLAGCLRGALCHCADGGPVPFIAHLDMADV